MSGHHTVTKTEAALGQTRGFAWNQRTLILKAIFGNPIDPHRECPQCKCWSISSHGKSLSLLAQHEAGCGPRPLKAKTPKLEDHTNSALPWPWPTWLGCGPQQLQQLLMPDQPGYRAVGLLEFPLQSMAYITVGHAPQNKQQLLMAMHCSRGPMALMCRRMRLAWLLRRRKLRRMLKPWAKATANSHLITF
eukprot:1149003-Pelagomonas_calceolata.AAC.2